MTTLSKDHAEMLAEKARHYLSQAQEILGELHEAGFDVQIKDTGQPYEVYADDSVVIAFNSNTVLSLSAHRSFNYIERV